MLFQNNFTVTRNLSKNIPFAPRTVSNSADLFEMIGASMSFARNAEIYGENEPADYLYQLVSGSGEPPRSSMMAAGKLARSIFRATLSASRSAANMR